MLKRCFATLALVTLLVPALQAGGAAKPTAVFRIRSLDALVENAKLLVTLAGREEIAKQVEGLVKAKIGAQGLEGIDPGRPFGAYAKFGKELDDISGAILVPIVSEKAFLSLLENLNYKAVKGKNDIYTIQTGTPIDAYLRFANGYAHVTALNAAVLEGKLADPVEVLGKDGPTIGATVHLDQLPEAARQLAVAQIEQGLQDLASKKIPGETPAQQAVRTAAGREFAKTAIGVIKDGGELALTIDVSAQTKELSAGLSLTGKSGTELAKAIANIGQGKSLFGGWRLPSTAFRGATHATLPSEIQQSINKLLDEGVAQGLDKIQEPAKRQQAQKLFDAFMPTLKSGELDTCVQLVSAGADGKFVIVGGVKLKDGLKLGTTLHDLVTDAMKQMPEAERALIKLDHDTVGAMKIHRLEIPANAPQVKQLRELLGETNFHVCFRDDAVFVSLGKDSLKAIKDAVALQASAASPVLSYELDVARLAPIVAPTDELRMAAKKIFVNNEDGLVRITLNGGTALRLSLTTRLAVVQFFSQAHNLKAGN